MPCKKRCVVNKKLMYSFKSMTGYFTQETRGQCCQNACILELRYCSLVTQSVSNCARAFMPYVSHVLAADFYALPTQLAYLCF